MSSAICNKDKMKKVLQWVSENVQNNPQKSRIDILREAEMRYDLSPKECAFLDEHFSSPCKQNNR